MKTELKNLIGKKILEVWINEEYLKFVTDQGNFVYQVTGDCCSHSYFYDFFGIKNLLNNTVESVEAVELLPSDVVCYNQSERGGDVIQVYGYRITSKLSDEHSWGGTTSVFSFRNSSNGYYGGSIDQVEPRDENSYYRNAFSGQTGEMKKLEEDIASI